MTRPSWEYMGRGKPFRSPSALSLAEEVALLALLLALALEVELEAGLWVAEEVEALGACGGKSMLRRR